MAMPELWKPRLGACYLGSGRCRFRVWAPRAERVELHIVGPVERLVPLKARPPGYFEMLLEDVEPGTRYLYRLLNGKVERPDPASRFQPGTVHEASAVVDPHFNWTDQHWHGIPLDRYILYEVHVGTFTPEGTFEAIIPHLEELVDLGITALELMPVAQFAGRRGWGYDGVYPFAPQNSYGGPQGLRRLVDACHAHGLAVVLDVVYNHFGPEGCYLQEFGPYFTDRYKTPWGQAINLDGPHSDEVRRYLTENALHWVHEYHVDALRLDAIHAIHDESASPFLGELARTLDRHAIDLNRHLYAIAESDLNDIRVIRPPELGGLGLHAQWADDFHHSLFTLLTREAGGYYQDYGEFEHLVSACTYGYTYTGQFSASRQRCHGNLPMALPGRQFVVCIQNHDQIGNRKFGERFGALASFEAQKLAAGTVLLSPFLPLLFMGEEYGETAPFQYFVDFGDPGLVEAVRRGRRAEFSMEGGEEAPDPQDEATFLRSKLNPSLRASGRHRVLYAFYRELLRLRRDCTPLRFPDKDRMELIARGEQHTLLLRRWEGAGPRDGEQVLAALNFGTEPAEVTFALPPGRWSRLLDSADPCWEGPGAGAPGELLSDGRVTLRLAPIALAVYGKGAGMRDEG
jgi:maltooligosyltrehalose trehalohydrolase